MSEVLPGVRATRTASGVVVEAAGPDPFYRLTLDPSIPDADMWFVFAEVSSNLAARNGLRASFSAVADPLAWARKWILSEERVTP